MAAAISLHFSTKQIPSSLKKNLKGKIRTIINLISKKESLKISEINYLFCDDDEITSINTKFLNHNYPTDIIAFYDKDDLGNLQSDVVISAETVKRNSRIYKASFKNELDRVIIHGLLHLCGYKDKTKVQKKEIREKEEIYLSLLNAR